MLRISRQFVLAAVPVGGVLILASLAMAARSTAAHPQVGPCLPTISPGTPEDPRLGDGIAVSLTVVQIPGGSGLGDGVVEELRFAWDPARLPPDTACIWVARGRPDQPDFSSLAEFVLPPTETMLAIRPTGGSEPAEVCYRFVPVSEQGHGPTTIVCAHVTHFRPVVISDPPFATPEAPIAGTGLVSDEGSGAWLVGFLVVTGTIVLVLVLNGGLRRRSG
jgi:hypothetical protein